MPIRIDRLGQEYTSFEFLGQSWDLREQMAYLAEWVKSADLDSRYSWCADVGFTPRTGATGSGPVLDIAFLRRCVELRLEIHLSEYDISE